MKERSDRGAGLSPKKMITEGNPIIRIRVRKKIKVNSRRLSFVD
jgi:hypothetical protein